MSGGALLLYAVYAARGLDMRLPRATWPAMAALAATNIFGWHLFSILGVQALASGRAAVEIHGAYGYSDEFPVERYLRNSRGAVIYEGTREIHTLMQAEYEMGYRHNRSLRCELPGWPFEG